MNSSERGRRRRAYRKRRAAFFPATLPISAGFDVCSGDKSAAGAACDGASGSMADCISYFNYGDGFTCWVQTMHGLKILGHVKCKML